MRTAPDHRREHGGHRLWWSAVLWAAVLSMLAAVAWATSTWPQARDALDAWRGAGEPRAVERVDRPSTDDAVLGRPAREGRSATPPAGRPRRLTVPSLGLRSPVVPIDLEGEVLRPPPDPDVVGWWRQGAPAGAGSGTTVITGHTVHTGGGAMDDLEQLERRDRVVVAVASGAVAYRVHRVEVLSTDALSARSADLFRQRGAPRMVLVTCEDWNGHEYESNVVVTALPVS